METVSIPINEYNSLVNELKLLKNQDLLKKLNSVIDMMYESKYGFYLGNYTDDLTKFVVDDIQEWHKSGDVWNEV